MKTSEIMQKVSNKLAKTAFKLKKASPELLVVGGVVGVVAAAVGACCATRKIDQVIEAHKADVEKIRDIESNDDYPEYTSKDAQHDLTVTYAKTAWKLIKLYAPSVILGAASITCIFTSHHILRKRSAALMAAYTAVDGAFKRYRKNVIDRFGEEVDKQLRFETKAEQVTVTSVDENGKEKKSKEKVDVQTGEPFLGYARCFDETNPNYKSNAKLNAYFIERVRKNCNDLLWARGYLFLNEVYDALDMPKSEAGQHVGWLRDGNGDKEVNFGIYTVMKERNKDFKLGYEPAVWLDFNVDGIIDEIIFSKY